VTAPRLTFYTELASQDLERLINETTVLDDLRALQAALGLTLPVLDSDRAHVVHCLNEAGIPMSAWLLLPKEQGLFLNVDNADQAVAHYLEFRNWTAKHQLCFAGVGLDIEPDMRELEKYTDERRGQLLQSLPHRLLDHETVRRAQMTYQALVMEMRADGYVVETAQLPWIVDERRVGSTLLQRVFRVVDVPADREILMLYTSFFKYLRAETLGLGILGSYISEGQVVGKGTTGGGVETTVSTWEEFERDLHLAGQSSRDIGIHSLEGCVRQGFLSRLEAFDWGRPPALPTGPVRQVNQMRQALRCLLWASAHPALVGTSLLGLLCFVSRWPSRRTR
jgi:hypothetical protein